MAETRLNGYTGGVTLPSGHAAKLSAWSADFDMTTSDVTAFGDTFRQFAGGVLSGRGSASGSMSYAAASTAPGAFTTRQTAASLTLTIATGVTYSGSALLSNIAVTSDIKGGDAAITFDFVFTGTITETWATA